MSSIPSISQLESHPYISFATYKRNGDSVATPVWFAGKDKTYYVFSEGDAGKVKRLRNGNKAKLALCDVRGKVSSDWLEAKAELFDSESEIHQAERLLTDKYGWQYRTLSFFSNLAGKKQKRAYIRIQID